VFAECSATDLFTTGEGEDRRVSGVLAYWRPSGNFVQFQAKAVVLATGGIGKSFKVTSNSWEYTGDGHAMAMMAGGACINMEFVQFHPTGMVAPPSVRGLLVTESVRGDGGVLTNSEGRRFMFDYIPEVFKDKYATTEEEADRWYTDPDNNKRPPELLPRDEVARAINTEVKAGRGSPHGGVFLDVSKRLPADVIKAKLPSMWHQFKELADVDITQEPMEVGPTCHYVMGGVEVDPDSQAVVGARGLFAAGEVGGGLHGSNRLGGNSLSDLLVFGKRAGDSAADYVSTASDVSLDEAEVNAAIVTALEPFTRTTGENPYEIQAELQQTMNDLVGIIRTQHEIEQALKVIDDLKLRTKEIAVVGGREYNPGWHLSLDLPKQLLVSEAMARSALTRQESRGGHTREDYPQMSPQWRQVILASRIVGDVIEVQQQSLPLVPAELAEVFDAKELSKYMTEEELQLLGKGQA
jgi:succinate dehydrogenase / fumarate reductase flavoprotein subunit